MDWNVVEKEMEKLKLTKFFHLILKCLEHWFDLQEPVVTEKIDEALIEEFEKYTALGGVFGYDDKKSGEMSVLKVGLFDKNEMRRKALLKSFFPPAKSIQSRYTYLQKRPYLLPVAWIDRIFRNYHKIGVFMDETKDIVTVNKDNIETTIEFYRRIGL